MTTANPMTQLYNRLSSEVGISRNFVREKILPGSHIASQGSNMQPKFLKTSLLLRKPSLHVLPN